MTLSEFYALEVGDKVRYGSQVATVVRTQPQYISKDGGGEQFKEMIFAGKKFMQDITRPVVSVTWAAEFDNGGYLKMQDEIVTRLSIVKDETASG